MEWSNGDRQPDKALNLPQQQRASQTSTLSAGIKGGILEFLHLGHIITSFGV